MNLSWIDWAIVFGLFGVLVISALGTRRYVTSVAGFLSANRCAGRYLLTLSEGIASLGAVSIIAVFQLGYRSGFAQNWWGQLQAPFALLLTLSGWVIYRFRETRALTMAQFFEMRYSRRFRIFAGTVCWISGIVNFGIFPAVGANFFINYCNLPETYNLAGVVIPTYYSLIVLLVALALFFALIGGQITVLITDFFQSFFCNVVLVAILVIVLIKFPMSKVFEGLMIAEEGKSMVNPFDTGRIESFPIWYFLLGFVPMFINRLAWQGQQGYNSSAKSPHEAKMAGVLGTFRGWGFLMSLTLLPLVAYMIMHHPDYTQQASQVRETLSTISNEQLSDQMITPVTMTLYMPIGLMGGFAAVMFAAFISTNDTYMHSFGSIFVQDVFMPLWKKPLTPRQHIWLLRGSIGFVALFIIIFSASFRQTQDILQWMVLSGAIWMGGAGTVIVGGLYTKWGTTAGAWAALIVGSVAAVSGVIVQQVWDCLYGRSFYFTGMEMFVFAILLAIAAYVLVSLLGKRINFNLDKMLHRGKYRVEQDHTVADAVGPASKWRWSRIIGYSKEFSFWDKFIYGVSFSKMAVMFGIFLVWSGFVIFSSVSQGAWASYHRYILWFNILSSFGIAVWLSIGGIRDVGRLFRDIKTVKQDSTDDGRVVNSNGESSEQT